MILLISNDEKKLILDGKEIYFSKDKEISKALIQDDKKIIFRLRKTGENIICIDFKGNFLWMAEDIGDSFTSSYDNFYFEKNNIYCKASLMTTKLDPNTGKILDREYSK